MVSALSPMLSDVRKQSSEECLSDRLARLCSTTGNGHTHFLTEVGKLLTYADDCVHVPHVNEIFFTPSLQWGRERIKSGGEREREGRGGGTF